MSQIELMDGGFLYCLRKLQQDKDNLDYGETILDNNPELAKSIYQSYIDIGCQFITSGNYPFKPMRQKNWIRYTEIILLMLYDLKKSHEFTLLGSIPPYYESYMMGEWNAGVAIYYHRLKQIVEHYADIYIIETVVSYKHLLNICKILDKSLPIIISLYPDNDVTVENLDYLIQTFNISAIMINCCGYNEMKQYFENIVSKVIDKHNKIKFGFYLNAIDEKKYVECCTRQHSCHKQSGAINLEKLSINNEYLDGDIALIKDFVKQYKLSNVQNNLIIGGCCGYGVDEIEQIKNIIASVKTP